MKTQSFDSEKFSELPEGLIRLPLQQRSRDRQKALLSTGLRLTASHQWSKVTVAEIAASSGMSVGTFYTRFRDKQAYLEVLVTLVADQMRQHMDEYVELELAKKQTATKLLNSFVSHSIDTYAKLEGVFRASVLTRTEESDHPFIVLRTYSREQFIHLLRPYFKAHGTSTTLKLGFAHQMINSTLVNTILTDPGPLRLKNENFRLELVNAMAAYLNFKN